MGEYFIMLFTHDGEGATPLVDSDGCVAFFDTMEAASDRAESNILGRSFGYEVFCLGEGVNCG